jgi:hypothetical protein
MGTKYKTREMGWLIAALFRGLGKGLNQASWSPSMYACFRLLFKGIDKVGIELEYKFGEETRVDTNYHSKLHVYNGFKHSRYTTHPYVGRELELVQLFPTLKPSDFVSSVVRFTRQLRQCKIDSSGSIHLNIVSDVQQCVANRYSNAGHYDFEGKYAKASRVENKYFSGFILPEDLLAQMLLYAFAFQVKNLNDYYSFRDIVIKERDLAVGSKLWAAIDLNAVLIH